MSLLLFMDEHVRAAVTRGLRLRGVTVLTAQEDGSAGLPDPALLDRAGALGCVVCFSPRTLISWPRRCRRQRSGEPFSGVIYAPQRRVSIGRCIDDLELLAKAFDPADMMNRIEYLPF